jgi:hypothetical protein
MQSTIDLLLGAFGIVHDKPAPETVKPGSPRPFALQRRVGT